MTELPSLRKLRAKLEDVERGIRAGERRGGIHARLKDALIKRRDELRVEIAKRTR